MQRVKNNDTCLFTNIIFVHQEINNYNIATCGFHEINFTTLL